MRRWLRTPPTMAGPRTAESNSSSGEEVDSSGFEGRVRLKLLRQRHGFLIALFLYYRKLFFVTTRANQRFGRGQLDPFRAGRDPWLIVAKRAMCLTQVALASAEWGGPPGPRRTPSSACWQAGQGAGRGRGRPPHIAPQNAGYLSQADTPHLLLKQQLPHVQIS